MCHSSACGRHFVTRKTADKILQSGFYWLTIFKDAHRFYMECLQCQAALNISKRDEMPMRPIFEVEIFDLWGVKAYWALRPTLSSLLSPLSSLLSLFLLYITCMYTSNQLFPIFRYFSSLSRAISHMVSEQRGEIFF